MTLIDTAEQISSISYKAPPNVDTALNDAEGHLLHINTGFTLLDKKLGGLTRSNMVIIAARPSMGKTTLALNIARNAALDQGAVVAVFSLEMSKLELAYRLISGKSKVSYQKIKQNDLNDTERNHKCLHSEKSSFVSSSPKLSRSTD